MAGSRRGVQTCAARGRGSAGVTAVASRDDVAAILDNLVENALSYSPTLTTVTIEWGSSGGHAFVAVIDDGPGIEPEETARVFERFYRGRASPGTPGTGLGLAVVAALARRWNGAVSLERRPTGGTRAVVRLPSASQLSLPDPGRRLRGLYPTVPSIECTMDFRRTARNVALGLLGLVAAVAIGLAANTISGDSVASRPSR